jgi:hypothetical protein
MIDNNEAMKTWAYGSGEPLPSDLPDLDKPWIIKTYDLIVQKEEDGKLILLSATKPVFHLWPSGHAFFRKEGQASRIESASGSVDGHG